jgi:hypothetical protein
MFAAVGATIAAYEYIREAAIQHPPQPTTQSALTTQTSTPTVKKRGSGFWGFLKTAWDFGKNILNLGLRIGAVGFAIYGGLSIARGLFKLVAGRATALGVNLLSKVNGLSTPAAMAA